MNMKLIGLTVLLMLCLVNVRQTQCQRGAVRTGGNNIVYGDIKVQEDQTSSPKPLALDILLYTGAGNVVSTQTVQSNGRYRFANTTDGGSQNVVVVENDDVGRFPVHVSCAYTSEIVPD